MRIFAQILCVAFFAPLFALTAGALLLAALFVSVVVRAGVRAVHPHVEEEES